MRCTTCLLAWVALAWPARPGASQSVAERIRAQLPPADRLAPFYLAREYRPAWVTDSGPLPAAAKLAAVLADAAVDGLDPADYAVGAIQAELSRAGDADALAQIELRLSRALVRYGSDLALGRLEPGRVDSLWTGTRNGVDGAAALGLAIQSGSVAEALRIVRPPQDGYALLRFTLGWYRAVAARGGWGTVTDGVALVRGARGERVRRLRDRLAATGDLPAGRDLAAEAFDSGLVDAVRRFQRRHGLEADGVVGDATLDALNVPVEQRIGQIALNLERWRWLPRDLGDRYLMINIPGYTLDVVAPPGGRVVMTMPVVVGRPDWPTPIVSAALTGLVFGPSWNVPRTIAVQELLPAVRRDPHTLTRQQIHVYCDTGGRTTEIDPDSVDWTAVRDSSFAFRLVQEPGSRNPLGGVKLVFPNRFDVAAHDTPERRLLAETVRTGSHGCVRLAGAADLATYLLRDVAPWSADSVRAAMARPEERWVALPATLPVHVVYWTAWVDEEGVLQFRPDVYGWDARLAGALAARAR